MRHVSDAIQDHFERNRNLLLDFLRSMARPLRNDLRVCVRNVRVGLDGKIVKRDDSPNKEDKRNAQHQNAIAQSKIDQVTDHLPCSATAEENSKAFPTIESPALSPSRIGCIPSTAPPSVCTSTRRNCCVP